VRWNCFLSPSSLLATQPTNPIHLNLACEECCFHFFVRPLPENQPKKLEKSIKILSVFRSVSAQVKVKIFGQQTSKENIDIGADSVVLVVSQS